MLDTVAPTSLQFWRPDWLSDKQPTIEIDQGDQGLKWSNEYSFHNQMIVTDMSWLDGGKYVQLDFLSSTQVRYSSTRAVGDRI